MTVVYPLAISQTIGDWLTLSSKTDPSSRFLQQPTRCQTWRPWAMLRSCSVCGLEARQSRQKQWWREMPQLGGQYRRSVSRTSWDLPLVGCSCRLWVHPWAKQYKDWVRVQTPAIQVAVLTATREAPCFFEFWSRRERFWWVLADPMKRNFRSLVRLQKLNMRQSQFSSYFVPTRRTSSAMTFLNRVCRDQKKSIEKGWHTSRKWHSCMFTKVTSRNIERGGSLGGRGI